MAEHYSKATTEASVWGLRCGKPTMHNVFDGRRGSCKECILRREQEAKNAPAPAATQESLF